MKQPKAITYLGVGGLVSGALVGGIYTVLVMLYWGLNSTMSLVNTIGFAVMMAIFVGIASAQAFGVVGFISGFIMDWRVKHMILPLSRQSTSQLRKNVYIIVSVLVGLLSIAGILAVVNTFDWNDPLFIESVLVYIVFPIVLTVLTAFTLLTLFINRLAQWQPPKVMM
ncbi:MAG: hypothetical protein AAF846_17950 [Chloroflexota bacterium]